MNDLSAFTMLTRVLKVLSDGPLKTKFVVTPSEDSIRVHEDTDVSNPNLVFELRAEIAGFDWEVFCREDILEALSAPKSSGNCIIDGL